MPICRPAALLRSDGPRLPDDEVAFGDRALEVDALAGILVRQRFNSFASIAATRRLVSSAALRMRISVMNTAIARPSGTAMKRIDSKSGNT